MRDNRIESASDTPLRGAAFLNYSSCNLPLGFLVSDKLFMEENEI